jgi:hypothetical protein
MATGGMGMGGRKERKAYHVCASNPGFSLPSSAGPVQSWAVQQRRADGRRGGDGEDDGDHHHQLT